MVVCCVCQKSYFYGCKGLTSSETRFINSKKSVTWTCSECEQLGNDIISLKAAIVALQNDVKALTSTAQATSEPKVEFEDLVQEVIERQNRRRNLMIFGLEEQQQSTKTDRLDAEKTDVLKIFTFLTPKSISITDVRRLGKFDRERMRPRPLKVTLADDHQVLEIIKKSANLKQSEFKNISLSPDKTPRQIEYFKKLKAELEDRRNKGETNVKIKYSNGMPKIVNF